MAMTERKDTEVFRYEPDYAVPPGETLRETIEALGMSQVDLAVRTQLSMKHINQIIQGNAPITPETALALEKVTGVPARFWVNLEANYQERIARQRDEQEWKADIAWAQKFPVKELVRRKAIEAPADPTDLVGKLLAFFGVANRIAWKQLWLSPDASFRQSPAFKADPYATAAWLRMGELLARESSVGPYNRAAFKTMLQEARQLTFLDFEEIRSRLTEMCATCGVTLVIVKEVKGSRASGATRWLTPSKPLIQLSLRYKWEDQFWFSFFHEAGHVLLHSKKQGFVDDGDDGQPEREANDFASSQLIPRRFDHRLFELRNASDTAIVGVASEIGISPAIVVGRLQHERLLPYSHGKSLRRTFELAD